ncbi:CPBP family intramembrane glutamic endopeptidase [Legionella saoudiensis]|uniref:CPBP family intramembrane glutamic endopeptidase n=1 Tax=Legionella saoudiensis TaxID=1750561 RepID=UPI00073192FE|nr:CPBP family intramembrane glutamic endopeptidase [Legionella saoudiensis]
MKNLTHSLGKFSIFKPQPNTGSNPNINPPSLTSVAAAIGVGTLTAIGNFEPEFITIYVACLALGLIYLPGFTAGLSIGFACALANMSLTLIMQQINPLTLQDSSYYRTVANKPLYVTLIAPVLEEVFFRGLLLPAMLAAITAFFPITTTMMFWGTGITLAAAISIGVTAGMFGLLHLRNDHEGAYRQALVATLIGIALGVTAIEFGLWAAIGAHIVNNSISYASLLFSLEFCQPDNLPEQSEKCAPPELSMESAILAPYF